MPDRVGERAGVGHGIVEERRDQAAAEKNPFRTHCRVDFAQCCIIVGIQEHDRRDRGTGADAADNPELGSRSGRGPTAYRAGTEGAVVTAA